MKLADANLWGQNRLLSISRKPGAWPMDGINPRFEYTKNDYLSDQIDEICEQVKFHGTYANDPERMSVLLSAVRQDDVGGLEEWKYEAELYPDLALVSEEVSAYANSDIPVRAYYLSKALKRLLEIVEAPNEMISDLMLLLSHFEPTGAQKYAKAQRMLIENPKAGITKISELSGLDRSTIHALLKKDVLVRPD